jgi:hypothetical protein
MIPAIVTIDRDPQIVKNPRSTAATRDDGRRASKNPGPVQPGGSRPRRPGRGGAGRGGRCRGLPPEPGSVTQWRRQVDSRPPLGPPESVTQAARQCQPQGPGWPPGHWQSVAVTVPVNLKLEIIMMAARLRRPRRPGSRSVTYYDDSATANLNSEQLRPSPSPESDSDSAREPASEPGPATECQCPGLGLGFRVIRLGLGHCD